MGFCSMPLSAQSNRTPRVVVRRTLATLATAFLCVAAEAQGHEQESYEPTDFVFRWNRPVGLPDFESPAANIERIRAAARAYLDAVGGIDVAGMLGEIPITPIPDGGRLRGAVIRKDPRKPFAECGADDFVAPTMVAPECIDRVVAGVYRSAADLLRDRARRWLESNPGAEVSARLAVEGFRRALEDDTLTLEDPGFAVRVVDLPKDSKDLRAARFARAGQSPEPTAEALSLTTLVGARIDPSSLPNLAAQFEEALERRLVLAVDDGRSAPVPLDFAVAVQIGPPPEGPVEIIASFVGPKERAAIPIRGFSLVYRGGDGSALNLRADPSAGQATPDAGDYDLPIPAEVLRSTTVALHRVRDGAGEYLTDFAPESGAADRVEIRLDTRFDQPQRFSIGALQAIFAAVTDTLQRTPQDGGVAHGDLIGVFTDADDGQLDLARGGLDIRADPSGEFAIKVVPGVVERIRAIALGERVEAGQRVNPAEPRFARMLGRAPFQPSSPTPQVLREEPLREYLDRQSRHPSRRVDAAITAVEPATPVVPEQDPQDSPPWHEQGTVGVDFLVSEGKPWALTLQVSNTGVEPTGEWQTRLAFFNSDAFGNDEIFSAEFVTTNLSDSNAFDAYFDAPIGESESLRWKMYAAYSQYTAADVGFAFADFEGESPLVGGEIAWNIAQWGKAFVDLVGGVRWTNLNVYNGLTGVTGDEDFLIPYFGARLQRNNRDATTDFAVYLDLGLGGDATEADLDALGRLGAARDWQLLRWDLAQSFYIDPLFQNASGGAGGTLAHELYFRFHGQNSLGNRLVPQFMGTAGGFYTVRGYPTSFVAGDDLALVTAEYRLHLPQLLGIDPNPQPFMGIGTEPFRLRPQFGYGATDWDFIVRGFVDAGTVRSVDRLSFEDDADLLGAGVGIELQTYRGLGYPTLRNIGLRLDVGFPLIEPDFTEVDDVQFTFVGTLSF